MSEERHECEFIYWYDFYQHISSCRKRRVHIYLWNSHHVHLVLSFWKEGKVNGMVPRVIGYKFHRRIIFSLD